MNTHFPFLNLVFEATFSFYLHRTTSNKCLDKIIKFSNYIRHCGWRQIALRAILYTSLRSCSYRYSCWFHIVMAGPNYCHA